jgi:hypothetical protein
MNIDNLTIGEVRAISGLFQGATGAPVGHPYEIGKNYFMRTVTHHLTGKLIEVGPQELVLLDAAWIADDGRFSDAIKTGKFAEVEPYPEGRLIVGRGSLIDAIVLPGDLPRSQK